MHIDGERPGQVLMATNTTGLALSHQFFVTNWTSGLRFLVDTRAEVSVLPVAQLPRASLSEGPSLQVVNNFHIMTIGTISRTLNLGLHQTFEHLLNLGIIRPSSSLHMVPKKPPVTGNCEGICYARTV